MQRPVQNCLHLFAASQTVLLKQASIKLLTKECMAV